MRRGGEEKKYFRGLLFCHAAVGSLITPSINIFAKETCFQGAFLLNNVPDSRRGKLRATAEFVLANHGAVRVRVVCQLVGQILSPQLSLDLVCRLRSRYLLLAIRDAAQAQNYSMVVPILGRALDELHLWAGSLTHLPEEPMYAHMRRADYVPECDASDHALGAIVVTAPPELVRGRLLSSPAAR